MKTDIADDRSMAGKGKIDEAEANFGNVEEPKMPAKDRPHLT
ncbi:hypothetical protein [Methylocystis sp. Sn-Cys]|nr:hypothetical protein [Methylocystis sp. Sn-Cys]